MEEGGGGGGGRRSLRYEFSREPNGSTAGVSVTLGGILSIKETSSYRIQNHTLLDLIRDDHQTCGNESNDSKTTWKMFREKLRLKLAGSVCTTAVPILASHVHIITGRSTTENGTNRLNSPSVSNISSVTVMNSTNRLNSPPVSNSGNVTVTQPENSTNRLNSPSMSSVPVTQPENSTNRLNSPSVSNSGNVTVTQPENSTNRLNSPSVRNTSSVTDTQTVTFTNLLNLPPVRTTSSVPDTQTANSNNGSVSDTQTVNEQSETPVTEENRDGGDGGGSATVKVSLMSLLEVEGSACFDDDEEEEVAEEGGDGGGGGGYNNCCVCMVRHKGAAFIPCGHTFCRVCSRELFVKRANCPLCNNFISEILDIF